MMSSKITYLTEETPFFSEQYLKVRAIENRVLLDKEVKLLPYLPKSHLYYREWRLRQKSTQRFLQYFSSKEKPQEVLDIGCGNGWFTHKTAAVSLQNKVMGLDINTLELTQAVRVFQKENLQFCYGNLFELTNLFDKKFTLITLNASVQYFKDFTSLFSQLNRFLKPNGEIHIIDSPFYAVSEIQAAKQRTVEYFNKMGVPKMSDYYHHHSFNDISKFEVLYKPKNSFFSKFGKPKDSPFIWLRYQKS